METRKPVKMSVKALKVFKEIARQFEVNDRDMFLTELFDKLAAKKTDLLKLLK